MVAIDGTRMAGNASRESTCAFEEIAREILAEAKATDEAEDELYGEARGDELPERLRTREGRAEFFRQAREERAAGSSDDQQSESAPELAAVTDPDTQRMKANNGNVQGTTPSPSWMRGRSCSPRSSLTNSPGDFSNLQPMVTATLAELDRVGIAERPQVALADAQYWNEQHMDEGSPTSTSRCWSDRTRAAERHLDRGGPAAGTHGCEPSWRQSTRKRCTENACR